MRLLRAISLITLQVSVSLAGHWGDLGNINCNTTEEPLDTPSFFQFTDLGNGYTFCEKGPHAWGLGGNHRCSVVRIDGQGFCISLVDGESRTPPAKTPQRAAAVYRSQCPTFNDGGNADLLDDSGKKYASLLFVKNATLKDPCGSPAWADLSWSTLNARSYLAASDIFKWTVTPNWGAQ